MFKIQKTTERRSLRLDDKMITFRNGDLFAVEADALAHGVNVYGVMGGIAGAFAQKFPLVSALYREKCELTNILPGEHLNTYENGQHILHVFSQEHPGLDARYEWLLMSLVGAVNQLVVEVGMSRTESEGKLTLAMPLIGCGIGGLDFKDFHNAVGWVAALYRDYLDIVVVYNDDNKHLIPSEVLAIQERILEQQVS